MTQTISCSLIEQQSAFLCQNPKQMSPNYIHFQVNKRLSFVVICCHSFHHIIYVPYSQHPGSQVWIFLDTNVSAHSAWTACTQWKKGNNRCSIRVLKSLSKNPGLLYMTAPTSSCQRHLVMCHSAHWSALEIMCSLIPQKNNITTGKCGAKKRKWSPSYECLGRLLCMCHENIYANQFSSLTAMENL